MSAAKDTSELLSLGKAASLLGVHPMTLRRWSDSGRFPCYRTAGGHRRFSMADVDDYLARQSTKESHSTPDDWASTALVKTRQEVIHHEEQRWLKTIDAQNLRDEYRQMGHQLMGLLLQYIAADDPNGTLIEEARRIGRRYGAYGMRAGLSLSSIVEATLFFRDILVESSLQVPVDTFVEPEANLRVLRRVNRIINTVQIAVTEFYETAGVNRYPKRNNG